ncbi:hypothetical protein NGTWS1803_05410 [Mycolicibacterium cyprinidarum]|nr:hypothetical protein NGTWS1803_05410 [Mycolicibacterium sp. NGTWS1803]
MAAPAARALPVRTACPLTLLVSPATMASLQERAVTVATVERAERSPVTAATAAPAEPAAPAVTVVTVSPAAMAVSADSVRPVVPGGMQAPAVMAVWAEMPG